MVSYDIITETLRNSQYCSQSKMVSGLALTSVSLMFLLRLRPIKSKPAQSFGQEEEAIKLEGDTKDLTTTPSVQLKIAAHKSSQLDTLSSVGFQPSDPETSTKRAKLQLDRLLPASTSLPSPVEAENGESESEAEDLKPLHIVETPIEAERPLWAALEDRAVDRGKDTEGLSSDSMEGSSASPGGG